MNNTNTFFSSDDEEKKDDDDLGFEMEENNDLLFSDKSEDGSEDDVDEVSSELAKDDLGNEENADENSDEASRDRDKQDESFPANDGASARDSDNIILSKSKITLIKKLLQNAKESNDRVIELLSVFSTEETDRAMISQMSDEAFSKPREELSSDDANIIEGVFDGENMIGPDGKEYSIPANYASKSKLVEGDILKLTILNNGTFIYKQIGPIDRDRIIGKLENGSNGQFVVTYDGKRWKVLTASVTYFKGSIGDEVIILVPKNADSQWAAVDNIVRNKEF